MAYTDIARVELFQLHVLRLLATGPVKSHLTLKGGCNLRFFFGSVRCSEDMDLDVSQDLLAYALREKVNQVLSGQPLATALRASGLEVTRVSAPKQTDTTQRWKIGLHSRAPGSVPLHTKVEFSRRPTREEAVLEAVSPDVLSRHQLLPLLVRHYPLATALRQKVGALVGRTVVQARDVFDLAVLLARAGNVARDALQSDPVLVRQAAERAMEISFDEFQSQVIAFLDPAHASMYETEDAWAALQLQVVEALQRAAP
jgi:predicted nucleotidyltransferase component of viral defense system